MTFKKNNFGPKDVNKLTLHNELGQGSFAKVYKAFWRGTKVAAKVFPVAKADKSIAKKLSVYKFVLFIPCGSANTISITFRVTCNGEFPSVDHFQLISSL